MENAFFGLPGLLSIAILRHPQSLHFQTSIFLHTKIGSRTYLKHIHPWEAGFMELARRKCMERVETSTKVGAKSLVVVAIGRCPNDLPGISSP